MVPFQRYHSKDCMKLIVGLGNPGSKYDNTRHNVGKQLVELIAGQRGAAFSSENRLKASVAQTEWQGESAVLAVPETFMNLSGQAVRKLVEAYGIEKASDLLIVTDDFAIPFGKLRLRPRGSEGGHNGLRSIIELLGTSDFARLRIGIGLTADKELDEALEAYVLSPFTRQEAKLLGPVLERSAEACRLWLSEPIETAMSVVNG